MVAGMLTSISSSAQEPSLKNAFKDDFYIGAALGGRQFQVNGHNTLEFHLRLLKIG